VARISTIAIREISVDIYHKNTNQTELFFYKICSVKKNKKIFLGKEETSKGYDRNVKNFSQKKSFVKETQNSEKTSILILIKYINIIQDYIGMKDL
jgi:hypothetical protein